jgi:hypothetical protein
MASCKCAPALLQLRKEVDERWPERDRSSDGCCGDAAHAARTSDHNPDASGYAHAEDIDENIAPNLGDAPLRFLIPLLLADERSKYVIYERRIYYRDCNVHGKGCWLAGGHAYNGINAHEHHLHLSIKATATFSVRPWLLALNAPPEEDDPMADPIVTAQFRREFVHDLYRTYSKTPEDRPGFDYWVGLLASGRTPEDVAKAFAGALASKNNLK